MSDIIKQIKLVSYNCQGIKTSLPTIQDICDRHDICLLQEHWLMDNELHILHNIHHDFSAIGVDTSKGILSGRLYGG